MLLGHNFIGFDSKAAGEKQLHAFSTVLNDQLPGDFIVATENEINEAVQKATSAFERYRQTSFADRALFLEAIADEIMEVGPALVERAHLETGLPEARITGERARTVGQLRLFAALLREGSFVHAIIDTALPDRTPLPRADLRQLMLPIGPVAVFAASNFPLAFSTAGGDTAAALAAGCPVVVKAHSAHLGTNELVAAAIISAAKRCGMPDGVFSSLIGEGAQLGQQLVKHPQVKAVGFTGSFRGGMALLKAAVNEREEPIPVYAEMSSINPVLVLPGKISQDADALATQLSGSITLGVGQFCTNPGLLFLVQDEKTDAFIQKLAQALEQVPAATMLNKAICAAYQTERQQLLTQEGVQVVLRGNEGDTGYKVNASLAYTTAANFRQNNTLHNEVFGPASLVVVCRDAADLRATLQELHGQLTGTVLATPADLEEFADSVDVLVQKVGRLIYNGVPTGVEVSHAMMHGGPFPATTFAHFTSVGTEAINRFLRPVCYQDCPQAFLPDALKDENPLRIMRKVNGVHTRDAIGQKEALAV
ncbi:NADP-dependent aldehyde dehydrogenase [Cnuella takakiae]|uniref:NADP-dependent aldehyde dehydrogenase n=1 Tax=Cnuella takakiae TaxID=1302690 RepID=A0A1M4YZ78_9BACT|nr:aldehyde dehydrogenase (NADP(+)) [Cnuella takakiae]OLY95029.1 aldehyde dehydrogenase (NADP(+)) [Cnuella takakiae]SHF11008.1 NADP-dependent aldehyde dehydrogenase [Cnuella takakiae]